MTFSCLAVSMNPATSTVITKRRQTARWLQHYERRRCLDLHTVCHIYQLSHSRTASLSKMNTHPTCETSVNIPFIQPASAHQLSLMAKKKFEKKEALFQNGNILFLRGIKQFRQLVVEI